MIFRRREERIGHEVRLRALGHRHSTLKVNSQRITGIEKV